MRINLSAIGWVTDQPEGNRLRWSYPTSSIDGTGKFMGLPEAIIIERAPTEGIKRIEDDSPVSSAFYLWSDKMGTITLDGFIPLTYKLSNPVQAVSFVYRGPKTVCEAWDTESNNLVAHQTLNEGDKVNLMASAFDTLVFFTFPKVKLEDLKILDLFKNRDYNWEKIAEIKVREAFSVPYQDLIWRYPGTSSFDTEQWQDLAKLWFTASKSSPNSLEQDEPSPLETIDLIVGTRWEYAVICGFGFLDGHTSIVTSSLDKIETQKLLKGPNNPPSHAYRVREVSGRVAPSNIVVCPHWEVAPLSTPCVPEYVSPQVKLKSRQSSSQVSYNLEEHTKIVTPDNNFPESVVAPDNYYTRASEIFEANYKLKWKQNDLFALGVEFEEEIVKSPSIPESTTAKVSFECRSHNPQLPEGELARSIEVPFHDVKIRCRCRATDGWDRTSDYSAWTPYTSLELIYNPLPPPLESVIHKKVKARIIRATSQSMMPEWTPDIILRKASAKLLIYRKTMEPRYEEKNVIVTTPAPVEKELYKTTVTIRSPTDFIEGLLTVDGIDFRIVNILGSDIFFHVPKLGKGHSSIFSAGPASLQQNPKHPSLWTKIETEFDITNLPNRLMFEDPLPDPIEESDTLSYYARLFYLGRLGPPGNIVSVVRTPPTPAVPPPFEVELLGRDFFNRTMIKITLRDESEGQFNVWWADGSFSEVDKFWPLAIPGEYKAQSAENKRILYDVLSLPIPKREEHEVTIAVQKVNACGGKSGFMINSIKIS